MSYMHCAVTKYFVPYNWTYNILSAYNREAYTSTGCRGMLEKQDSIEQGSWTIYFVTVHYDRVKVMLIPAITSRITL